MTVPTRRDRLALVSLLACMIWVLASCDTLSGGGLSTGDDSGAGTEKLSQASGGTSAVDDPRLMGPQAGGFNSARRMQYAGPADPWAVPVFAYPQGSNDLSAADLPPPPPLTPGTVRVGLLLPLSGEHAEVGQSMLKAAEMAVFDLGGDGFELLPYDTRGTPQYAQESAAIAVGDGASLLLGPLFASSVRAASPIAVAANIPVIGFSNDRSVASGGVFVMGISPAAEVERVVEYAATQGTRRLATVAPDNTYGATIATAIDQAAASQGVRVTRFDYYDPATVDFGPVVQRLVDPSRPDRPQIISSPSSGAEGGSTIKRVSLKPVGETQAGTTLPFDTLLIADGGSRLQSLATQLPVFGIDSRTVRLLGTSAWAASGSEPALEGGWFAAPSPRSRADFEQRYQQFYGTAPAPVATLAYDATALAILLARRGEGYAFSYENLTAEYGFSGRDGIFRFRPDGVVERRLAVLELYRGGATVIDEPAGGFPPSSGGVGY